MRYLVSYAYQTEKTGLSLNDQIFRVNGKLTEKAVDSIRLKLHEVTRADKVVILSITKLDTP